uniref:Uncharacterized protein n=1 Tax=Arundo donax TaxID=35708 RepID=A0A0A9GQ44_ARUDO
MNRCDHGTFLVNEIYKNKIYRSVFNILTCTKN